MSVNDIPEECLNDPHFIQVLVGSLLSDAAAHKKRIADSEVELKELKMDTVGVELEQRKQLKARVEEQKQKITLLEPTIESLTFAERHLSEELDELKASLDPGQLKIEREKEAYNEILEQYKSTWENYKNQYETMEFAVERKQEKVASAKLKIKLMTLEYKEKEQLKMLKQRRVIDQIRIRTKIIEMAKLLLSRWERQNLYSQLKCNVSSLANELRMLENKHKNIRDEIEENEKAAALARQQMPPPRLDISFVRAFYSDTRSDNQFAMQRRKSFTSDLDSDSISIDSVMFAEMCKSDNDRLMTASQNTDRTEEIQEKSPPCSEKNSENRANDSNLATLETCYRRLSIEKEDSNVTEPQNSQREEQVGLTETPQKDHECIEHVLKDTEKKIQSSENLQKNEEVVSRVVKGIVSHEKRTHSSANNQLDQDYEPESKKNKFEEKERTVVMNSGEHLDRKNEQQIESSRQMPQIRKVENMNHIIKVTKDPTVAELPRSVSNYFMTHDYTPSCASNDEDMSAIGDSEFDENRGPYGLDLQQNRSIPTDFSKIPSWMDTCSPSESQSSFRTDVSAIKNLSKTEELSSSKNNNFTDSGSSFFNFFSTDNQKNPGTKPGGFF